MIVRLVCVPFSPQSKAGVAKARFVGFPVWSQLVYM